MKIIDNINLLLGDDLKLEITSKTKLKIAASCFSIYAFEELKSELKKVSEFQFIFTSPTFTPENATDKIRKERREFFIPKRNRERSLYGSNFEIHLKNKLNQKAIAKECADWIRKKAIFKSNKSQAPMQQFIHASTADASSIYAPLSGFTAVDLGYQPDDAASSITHKTSTAEHTNQYLEVFQQLWNDEEKLHNVTDTLCEHIESVYQENSPERIYFLILYNIFREFLEDLEDIALPNDLTGYQETQIWKKLFNFQKDAAIGIINKLETYNGCILADSVGLGKTFTALAVVKYYELRNRSVLILTPKKLAENWSNYNANLKTNIFIKDRLNYDVLCHTDLSRHSGHSLGIPLNQVNWGNYDLVVIDESHNFRNNDTFRDRETRYQKLMNTVIRQGVKTKVLMLSATPVNNRFNDLKNQLALAYEGESKDLSAKLKSQTSVEEIFRKAQAAFNQWSNLDSEKRTAEAILQALDFDFFELLDNVTIARSRRHIETFYDVSDIGTFPKRNKPISHYCPLTKRSDVMGLDEIVKQFYLVNLSVYAPLSYVLPSRLRKYEELYDTQIEGGAGKLKQADREKNLQALMTTNLLKRLESSVEAFRLTLSTLLEKIDAALKAIQEYEETGGSASIPELPEDFEIMGDEDDDIEGLGDFTIGGKIKIDLSDMDLPAWKRDLETDQDHFLTILASMQKIKPEDDEKLQHLMAQISDKIFTGFNSGNKKVLIFTAFADTAHYLFAHLSEYVTREHQLHTAKVTGSGAPRSTLEKNYDFQSILTLFAPESKDKDIIMPEEPVEIDVLIGTDCISEGQNLQDCDCVINYDIHWNPVRIIQRFGRIDRIGSPNEVIQLINYWPDITLDAYINLRERVENRMVIADVSATGEDNVLTSKGNNIAYRKEQLRRLQDEVIELEDVKTGISITDLGLNDFRMDLLAYLKDNGDIERAPNGMHAVVEADESKGLKPGVIFALKNIHDSVNINQLNRLHPYYLVYIAQSGEVIIDHTEVKKLLDLVRTSCKGRSAPIRSVCRIFNRLSDDGKDMAAHSALLSAAIQSMITVKEQKDMDSLFRGERTSALTQVIAGLDDFELIAFLVIQEK